MNKEYRVRQFLNRFLFGIYLLLLVYLVLFKGPLIFKVVSPIDYTLYQMNLEDHGSWGYNLVPFRTIKTYFGNKEFYIPGVEVSNVFGNIILFMPFGFLFPLVFRRWASFAAVVLATFLLSFGFEIIQFAANLGFSDVDDVILNVTGGVTGFWFFYYLYHDTVVPSYQRQ